MNKSGPFFFVLTLKCSSTASGLGALRNTSVRCHVVTQLSAYNGIIFVPHRKHACNSQPHSLLRARSNVITRMRQMHGSLCGPKRSFRTFILKCVFTRRNRGAEITRTVCSQFNKPRKSRLVAVESEIQSRSVYQLFFWFYRCHQFQPSSERIVNVFLSDSSELCFRFYRCQLM